MIIRGWGRSRLDKTRPRSRESGLCCNPPQPPHPCPSRPKGNPASSHEVTGDLCSCLDQGSQTRLGSYPTSLSCAGRQCHHWYLLATHTCTDRASPSLEGASGGRRQVLLRGCGSQAVTSSRRQLVSALTPRSAVGAGAAGAPEGAAPRRRAWRARRNGPAGFECKDSAFVSACPTHPPPPSLA